MTARPPTVRRRRLGAELRRLRELQGYTADEVAARLRWSSSKLSRIENARISVREPDVVRLLEICRVDEKHASEVLALCRAAAQRGWWEEYTQDISPHFAKFIALEDEADSALDYETLLVPGLLQVEEYAEQVLRSFDSIVPMSARRISRRLDVRMRRQRILTRNDPLRLSIVMDESVLLRNVGGVEVMLRQLDHLTHLAGQPNISLQILPLQSTREPLIGESFVLLQFSAAYETRFPDVVHVDTLAANEVQKHDVTSIYKAAWKRLSGLALPPAESTKLISRKADDYLARLR